MENILYKKSITKKLNSLLSTTRNTFFLLFVFIPGIFATQVDISIAKISFSSSTLTVQEALKVIEMQTDFLFVYNKNDVNLEQKVSVNNTEATVPEILNDLFDEIGITYTITGKNIVLVRKNSKSIPSQPQSQQQQRRTITVVVTDNIGAVIGANVMVKGTNVGNITNLDGHAVIENAPSNGTIVVSYIGYVTREIAINNQTTINVTIVEDTQTLDELIVVGYGVQRKSDVTGAISSLRSEDMENRATENVAQSLQGKSAGVQILLGSGAPGTSSQVRIRGFSSNSSSDPLFLVDGLKVNSIDYLDPESVESIEILKDAASAAIYGAEAGNGVVLITTKSGRADKNRTGRVFFNMQYTGEKASNIPKVLKAKDYIDFMVEGGQVTLDALNSFYDGKTDTNWAEEVFETGETQRYSIGFQNGNEVSNLFVSLTNQSRDGIFSGNKDVFDRLTGQINADYKIKDWLKVGTTNAISKSRMKTLSQGNTNNAVFASVMLHDPLTPVTLDMDNLPQDVKDNLAIGKKYLANENGEIWGMSYLNQSQMYNPFFGRDLNDNETRTVDVNGTAYAEFTPIKDFIFTSKLGYRISNRYYSNYRQAYYYNPLQSADKESLRENSNQGLYYQWENYINYLFSIGKNKFTTMAGMSYRESKNRSIGADTDELTNLAPNYRYLDYSTPSAIDNVSGTLDESSSISYFGRLGWSFDNKYNLQVNFRADAYDASKLDKSSRWGYFPSVSAGWTVSNESWMSGINESLKMSNLRLRASWGINGNVNVLSNYRYANTLASGYFYMDGTGGIVYGTYPQTVLANPNLSWEESKQIDVGLGARFFNGRLSFDADFYSKNTNGLLIAITPALSTGASTKYVNAGIVHNRGFEFELGWKDNIGNFTYSINGNLSTLHNKVKEAPSVIAGESQAQNTISYFEEGYPIWYLKTYKVEGIDNKGYAIYKEIDGIDGITDADREYAGSAIPDITFGITLYAAYKGFDLTVFGSGVAGNELYYGLGANVHPTFNRLEHTSFNRWTESNQNTMTPSAAGQFDNRYFASDGFVFDASYFKIKQIQLGYTIPKQLLRKIFVSSLKAYVSLDDFFTFTSYPGMDPEAMTNVNAGMAVDKGQYPISKKITFGLNLSF